MNNNFFRNVFSVAKGSKGFTLVELMTSVAIVGILSAIAIPNYQKYQRKAASAEAKIKLGSIFTAEQAYSVEKSTYTCCLLQIGAISAGAAPVSAKYSHGFIAGCPILGWGGPANCAAADTWSQATGTAQTDLTGSTVAAATFIATAAGQLGGAALDKWTVDQTHTIVNTVNGL